MPQFTINLADGGQVVVNASDAGSVQAPEGSTVTSGAYTGGGGGSGGGGGPSPAPQPAQPTGGTPYSGGGGSGGEPVYQTVNGPRTMQQMQSELMAVGWGGIQANDPTSGRDQIINAYSSTTRGQVQGPGSPMGGGAGVVQGLTPQQPQANDAALRAWQQYLQAQSQSGADQYQLQLSYLALEQEKLALDKQRAEQDMQLARNADARADAILRIQQADQALRENQFKQSQLEFDKSFAEGQRQFNQNQYTNLAQSLLQGAASLRGPRDWAQYAQFTGGGRNLQQQLFGGEANPAFGGERGQSPSISVGDVMNQLGFVGGQPPTQGQPQNVPLPHQINPASWDSMSPQARELTLGLAQGGYTANGVYTPEDYERLINASRPVGTASRLTRTQYNSPMGAF